MSDRLSNPPNNEAPSVGGMAERDALLTLHRAWGIPDNAPLVVIGRLRTQRLADERSLYFLEELENPQNGAGLIYPLPSERDPARAIVAVKEIIRITKQGALPPAAWAIAELELSPRHHNPFNCAVRRGSLRLLSEVPEGWNLTLTGAQSAQRLAASAREAIEGHIKDLAEKLSRDLEAGEQKKASILADLNRSIEEAESLKKHTLSTLDEKIQRTEKQQSIARSQLDDIHDAIRLEQDRLKDLNEHVRQETQRMQNHFRRLADLLDEKGARLVALDLIDEDDLKALLPAAERADERQGHDFQSALGGDFARVAPFVQARLARQGLLFSKAQIRDALALIRTHDLIVLAGDSGSGKTSLIRALAEAIGARCTVIPVKPNWTGPEDLLGYYNPIERSYQPTPFLQALQAAHKEPDVPHFICLDEMNLARVEYYFADFLSLLESRSATPTIPLYTSDEERHTVVENSLFLSIEAEARAQEDLPDTATLTDLLRHPEANRLLHQLGGFQDAESVLLHHSRLRRALAALVRTPTQLTFPSNVRIFGAINIDETTHYLSPKVLDRVHVLRFRNPVLTNWDELEADIEDFEIDLDLPLRLTTADLPDREDYPPFDRSDPEAQFLAGLSQRHLDPLGVEFGLRAIRQAANYIRHAERSGIEKQAALNNVVLHKIMPKLMFDASRTGGDGRLKRDILISLRDELADRMAGLDMSMTTESCVSALDRLIASAESNNGIVSYWWR
nr:AAA family ATPase [Brevundimonas diminuta]